MSLQVRLAELITAVGGDIKALFSRSVPAGGTVGQQLVKASEADYDVAWSSPLVGGSQQVFVQPTQPVVAAGVPYSWYQTGLGTDGTGITLWVDDGQV